MSKGYCEAYGGEFLEDAKVIKERFPDLLASFTIEQVCEIWHKYSDEHWCATWMMGVDEDVNIVRHVFTDLYPLEVQE
jgi:hypothetical protein